MSADPRAAWNAVERLRALGAADLATDLSAVLRMPTVDAALCALLDVGSVRAAEQAAEAVGTAESIHLSLDAMQNVLDQPCPNCGHSANPRRDAR